MAQEDRALPGLGKVPEGGVEGAAALLVAVAPGQGEPALGDPAAGNGEVDLPVGQPEQHPGFGVQGAEQVDLVAPLPASGPGAPWPGGPVDHLDGELLRPGVAVEAGADQRAVLGPAVTGIGGRVHAQDTEATGVPRLDHRRPLDRGEGGLPDGEEGEDARGASACAARGPARRRRRRGRGRRARPAAPGRWWPGPAPRAHRPGRRRTAPPGSRSASARPGCTLRLVPSRPRY